MSVAPSSVVILVNDSGFGEGSAVEILLLPSFSALHKVFRRSKAKPFRDLGLASLRQSEKCLDDSAQSTSTWRWGKCKNYASEREIY